MKLQPDTFNVPTITGYGAGWLGLDGERIGHSLVIGSRGERLDWGHCQFADLDRSRLALLLPFRPELVIVGCGERLRRLHPALAAELAQHRIGLETMDTPAACRTFNILAGEGRHVLAALLIERKPD